jgi:hypothetical protein
MRNCHTKLYIRSNLHELVVGGNKAGRLNPMLPMNHLLKKPRDHCQVKNVTAQDLSLSIMLEFFSKEFGALKGEYT